MSQETVVQPKPLSTTTHVQTPDGVWDVATTVTTTTSTVITPVPSVTPPTGGIVIPPNAKTSGILDNSPNWKGEKDSGTGGSVSSAFTKYIDANSGRQFNAVQTNHAGYRWHNSFGKAAPPTHFVYDLYVKSDSWLINQLELDMNHVLPDGTNVFLCTQVSQGSKTWEYTLTPSGKCHWYKSNLTEDISKWPKNTWIHFRIKTSHDAKGNVVYEQIEQDGVVRNFDSTCKGLSAFKSNPPWAADTMLINYQMDGATANESTMNSYAKQVQVWYW